MKFIKIALFNLVLFVVLLFVSEVFLRVIYPNKITYQRTYPGQYENKYFDVSITTVNWPKLDKTFGWVCNNKTKLLKFSNPIYNKRKISYSIDEKGFRKTFSFDEDIVKSHRININLLGDSFVFGVYLDDFSTIATILQKFLKTKYVVANYGIPGWGIDQMYLSYLNYVTTSKGWVILFYIDDDIMRVLEAYRYTEGMNKPSFEIIGNKLVFRDNVRKDILVKLFENSLLLNPFYKRYCKNKAINISKTIFKKLKQLTKRNGQNLLIVHIPVKEQVLEPNKYSGLIEKNFFETHNINFLDFSKYFSKYRKKEIEQFYLLNDGHLTEKGALKVAEILKNKILHHENGSQ